MRKKGLKLPIRFKKSLFLKRNDGSFVLKSISYRYNNRKGCFKRREGGKNERRGEGWVVPEKENQYKYIVISTMV